MKPLRSAWFDRKSCSELTASEVVENGVYKTILKIVKKTIKSIITVVRQFEAIYANKTRARTTKHREDRTDVGFRRQRVIIFFMHGFCDLFGLNKEGEVSTVVLIQRCFLSDWAPVPCSI